MTLYIDHVLLKYGALSENKTKQNKTKQNKTQQSQAGHAELY